MVIAALIRNPLVAAVFLATAEAFSTAGGSMCWATGADIAPVNGAGQVGGIMNTAAGIGGITAPIVTGLLLTATHSFVGPLLIAALIQVIAALSYGLVLTRVETLTIA
jgi:sugar phosphate permease